MLQSIEVAFLDLCGIRSERSNHSLQKKLLGSKRCQNQHCDSTYIMITPRTGLSESFCLDTMTLVSSKFLLSQARRSSEHNDSLSCIKLWTIHSVLQKRLRPYARGEFTLSTRALTHPILRAQFSVILRRRSLYCSTGEDPRRVRWVAKILYVQAHTWQLAKEVFFPLSLRIAIFLRRVGAISENSKLQVEHFRDGEGIQRQILPEANRSANLGLPVLV
ncbi:LAQU0S01e10814g1_1 [Lachancea quebecensis]|uniref:LAQU0S01e10814g1_1 n=1 Tax=Lachancea quebecensis TaxID=1654605 RepID=A0A0P1KPS2_9SACH|nr:LAQU0S01e10814g1_1 [Lachancea quebecensis]